MAENEDDTPAAAIDRQRRSMARLSDEDFLAAIRTMEPPGEPDDADPYWQSAEAWEPLYRLVAMADEVGRRRLVAGIGPVFALATLGDAYGVMESLRHGPEGAATAEELVAIMRPLVRHPRAGARRWAAHELGILRDPATFDDLAALASGDPEATVRVQACSSLVMLTQATPELVSRATSVLRDVAANDDSEEVRFDAAEELASLDPELAGPLRRSPVSIDRYTDPSWVGDASGPEGYLAVRRVIRALITGELHDERLDAFLDTTGRALVMTPGDGVYPEAEPARPADGSAPDWAVGVRLWAAVPGSQERAPTGLLADIGLRRAGADEVRARLRGVVDEDVDRVEGDP